MLPASSAHHAFQPSPLILPVLAMTLATLAGCSSAMSPPITDPSSTNGVYVIVPNTAVSSSSASEIVQFPSNANGAVSPSSTLILPTNFATFAFATDSSGNLYVGGNQGSFAPVILVYAAGSSGSATPSRTIAPALPNGDGIYSMTIDATGQLYLTTSVSESIQVLPASSSGSVTPTRSIQWDPTQFTGGDSIAVDGSGFIYLLGYCHCTAAGLSNPTEVVVYSPDSSGSAAPARTIVGPNAEFGSNNNSIAVDAAGDLFAIIALPNASWLNAAQVAEFAPGATGNAAPIKTIVGNYGAAGVSPTHLQIDANDNIFVFGQYVNFDLPQSPILSNPFMAAFPATASGTATPSTQFSSAAINDGAYGLAFH